MTARTKPVDAARFWIKRGFLPVPVKPRTKKPYNPDDPGGRNWQNLRITEETASHYFNGSKRNVGVLLGGEHGHADVDLDCMEAIRIAADLLPVTGLKFGRKSKQASHWFYRIDQRYRP